jgi:GH15 family glucan-1,4-alpha-glucosidase
VSLPIEDYALIGDTQTAALVSTRGSIDWLCLPRFDSGACFAALLGDEDNGCWTMAPAGPHRTTRRSYRGNTLILETEFTTDDGCVRVVDFMPLRNEHPDLVRCVEGVRGRVRMRSRLTVRFDYGDVIPWLRRDGRRLCLAAGPDIVLVDADVDFDCAAPSRPLAEFDVAEGDTVDFHLACLRPREPEPEPVDVDRLLSATERWWREWADPCRYQGPHRDAVVRSLITLKALTYEPSGGIVAAPTTSLPEQIGGVRNWDYRYCWIRDATLSLLSLLKAGYEDEAKAWREWLVRAVAGDPAQMRLMYGIEGERRLKEVELDWLAGYDGSRPVRVGNHAASQWQLDVYGELMDALHQARSEGIPPDDAAWQVQRTLMDFLESGWREPDNGIWEMRGPPRHFTHSKVMAWTAADRAVKAVERFGQDGPADRWRRLRREIADDVLTRGYDAERGAFTQSYGSQLLDASLLMIPYVGFLPATDERMRGTVAAIERELCTDGFVLRYSMGEDSEEVDGLPTGEGAFLPCSFWLADNYVQQGRVEEGRALFERLLGVRNDVGLLAEEYDPRAGRLLGNFPQALSHLAVVDTAFNLQAADGPLRSRAESGDGGGAG